MSRATGDRTSKNQSRRLTRRQLEKKLVDAAVIWHAETIISGQDARDSKADKQLRRAAARLLKEGWKV